LDDKSDSVFGAQDDNVNQMTRLFIPAIVGGDREESYEA
jgi:hypothetical protein